MAIGIFFKDVVMYPLDREGVPAQGGACLPGSCQGKRMIILSASKLFSVVNQAFLPRLCGWQ